MPTAALAQPQRQTFRDANGREVGRSVSDGRNTMFYDAMGRNTGTLCHQWRHHHGLRQHGSPDRNDQREQVTGRFWLASTQDTKWIRFHGADWEPAGEAFRARAPTHCRISNPHGRGGFQRGAGLPMAGSIRSLHQPRYPCEHVVFTETARCFPTASPRQCRGSGYARSHCGTGLSWHDSHQCSLTAA